MSETQAPDVRSASGGGADRRKDVEEAVAAFNAHDAAAFAATYSQDAVVHTSASPEPVRGRAAIEQDIQEWITAMPDTAVHVEELIVEGHTAAMRLLFTGTHTGPLITPAGVVPPTGKRVSLPMAVFTRQGGDGMNDEEHRYLDMASMAQQLGLA